VFLYSTVSPALACARQLTDPEFTVSGRQELRLIRNVIARLGDRTALGLSAGVRYHFTAYGALGIAMVSSRSVRSALDVVPQDVVEFVVERAIGAMITVARDLYGPAPMLRRLELRSQAPTDVSAYEVQFRLKPRFGATNNLIVLDRAQLEGPLVLANEPARQAVIEQCRRLLEVRKVRSGLASTVRSRLVTASAQMPTMLPTSA
jgi:hypothetical protein